MLGSVVDLILLVLVVVFAINGYRQGFVVGLLSIVGFFGGALLGLQLGPLLARNFTGDTVRVLVSLGSVFALAAAGQALAGLLGSRLRSAIRNVNARRVDDIGGAVVSSVAVLFVVWLVAAPLASSSIPGLARSVRNSAILNAVDSVIPDQARALSQALRDTVDNRNFPDVFGGLSPTRVREVPTPDPKLAGSPVVANAHQSVVKVLGSAPSCSRHIEGTGFVYAQQHVMTNAHVVAGTKNPVTIEVNGRRLNGTVVVFDAHKDLAVIYVRDLPLDTQMLQFSRSDAETGTDAIVLGYPLDGAYDAQSARIRDLRDISGPDIYESGKVTREIYTIRGKVRSGNSGGPLVGSDGSVYGVIFAAAVDDEETGFALSANEAAPVRDQGRTATAPVDTGPCT